MGVLLFPDKLRECIHNTYTYLLLYLSIIKKPWVHTIGFIWLFSLSISVNPFSGRNWLPLSLIYSLIYLVHLPLCKNFHILVSTSSTCGYPPFPVWLWPPFLSSSPKGKPVLHCPCALMAQAMALPDMCTLLYLRGFWHREPGCPQAHIWPHFTGSDSPPQATSLWACFPHLLGPDPCARPPSTQTPFSSCSDSDIPSRPLLCRCLFIFYFLNI